MTEEQYYADVPHFCEYPHGDVVCFSIIHNRINKQHDGMDYCKTCDACGHSDRARAFWSSRITAERHKYWEIKKQA